MDWMSNNDVTINKLVFTKFLTKDAIQARVEELAKELKNKYENHNPIFVILLNGAFVFASDLLRQFDESAETLFLKVSSYHDLESTGNVTFDKNFLSPLSGRSVILIEDIIDTGNTMVALLKELKTIGVKEVALCTLLLKPNKLKHNFEVQHVGFSIADEFVVGYGLDYNEQGRNLRDIYQLKSQ